MALPASGQITFNQIATELGISTSNANMDTMTATATGNSTITNEPDSTADWYSYSHTDYGRLYTSENWSGGGAYIFFNGDSIGFLNHLMAVGGTAVLLDTAGSAVQSGVSCFKGGETAFGSGDFASVVIYRRTKNTTGSWSPAPSGTFFTYTSQTYSCDFDTYDYWWDLYDSV